MSATTIPAPNPWRSFPELRRDVAWSNQCESSEILCEAAVDGRRWAVRLNEFPTEALYTLVIDGQERVHFDDWPGFWRWPGV